MGLIWIEEKAVHGTRDFQLEFKETPGGHPVASFGFYFNGVMIEDVFCLISGAASSVLRPGESQPGPPAPPKDLSSHTPLSDISREELFKGMGVSYLKAVFLKQVHGREVFETGKGNPIRGKEGDGLITIDRSVVLSVTVADCLPIYLYDTESGAIGLLHSGWRGTGIVLNALDMMKEKWGTRPGAVSAVLGPCISNRSYNVDRERAVAFDREFGRKSKSVRDIPPQYGSVIRRDKDLYFIDLQSANKRLLYGAGVRNISYCINCTFMDTRLGSYRREGPSYTRMNALCGYSESLPCH